MTINLGTEGAPVAEAVNLIIFSHTRDYGPLEFDPYLWAAVAIWSFDRFVRIVRCVYCNIHVRSADLTSGHWSQRRCDRVGNEELLTLLVDREEWPMQQEHVCTPCYRKDLTGWNMSRSHWASKVLAIRVLESV